MEEKKPSTAEILAKIRAQKAGGAAPTPAAEAAPTPPPATPEAPAASAPAAAAAPVATPAPAKPAAPAAKPGSTKDILAAIRAQGGKGAAPAAAASATPPAPAAAAPAAPVAAAAKPVVAAAPAAPTGPLPSVADMVRAARSGAPVAGAAAPAPKVEAPAKPVAPPMPQRPVPSASKKQPDAVRRGFFLAALIGLGYVFATPFRLAWTAITVVSGISVLGTARFMFPNVLVEPPSKFKVGPASDYPLNTVSNKWKDQFGIWVVHTDQYQGKNLIFALQSVCTHLGCTPNWLDGEQKFKCPCHGSGFYMTGVNFEGPAPRPLERMGLRVAEDGMLEVDKSVKFQEEMGQWTDAASFVEQV